MAQISCEQDILFDPKHCGPCRPEEEAIEDPEEEEDFLLAGNNLHV